ncbi:hypothetical protein [Pseudomonas tohonis]|uniref:hypothetical protein n=1 Tax=Pseudomonas tohonis TaxID=2725477 RepID=UPI0021D879F1|nr:hypothetical protein [Pseudomonas tohonis]UXY54967.1 hypothetical protein N9L84_10515 [Pseudomonas tohonis]
MTHVLRITTLFLGLALLTGCAGFRSGETENLGNWPQAGQQKPSLRYVVEGKVKMNDVDGAVQPATVKAWSDITGKAYKESNLFSSVTEGFGDADITAEVKVTNDGHGSMALAFISGLTLMVVPSTAEDRVITQTTYRSRDGKVLAEVTKQDSVRTWMQILLFPGVVVANPFSKINQIHYDNNKATILDASKNGVF